MQKDYIKREVNASPFRGESFKEIEIGLYSCEILLRSLFFESRKPVLTCGAFQNLIQVFEKMHEKIHGTILDNFPSGEDTEILPMKS